MCSAGVGGTDAVVAVDVAVYGVVFVFALAWKRCAADVSWVEVEVEVHRWRDELGASKQGACSAQGMSLTQGIPCGRTHPHAHHDMLVNNGKSIEPLGAQ